MKSKAMLAFGIAASLGLMQLTGGQALAQGPFFEPADDPGDAIVVEAPEIFGLSEIAEGPLIIYGAYASVGDEFANASDDIVPLGAIVGAGADNVGDIDVVITDSAAG